MPKVLDTSSDEYKLGQQIRKYRELRKMSQQTLADLVGMERANLSHYENGDRGEMGFKTLLKFAQALEVSTDCLLGEEDDGINEILYQLDDTNRSIIKSVGEGLLLKQKTMA